MALSPARHRLRAAGLTGSQQCTPSLLTGRRHFGTRCHGRCHPCMGATPPLSPPPAPFMDVALMSRGAHNRVGPVGPRERAEATPNAPSSKLAPPSPSDPVEHTTLLRPPPPRPPTLSRHPTPLVTGFSHHHICCSRRGGDAPCHFTGPRLPLWRQGHGHAQGGKPLLRRLLAQVDAHPLAAPLGEQAAAVNAHHRPGRRRCCGHRRRQ